MRIDNRLSLTSLFINDGHVRHQGSLRILLIYLFASAPMPLLGQQQTWSLDAEKIPEVDVFGDLKIAKGVSGNSVVLDGQSLLKMRDTDLTQGSADGFTVSVWVNPYEFGEHQQVIAAKNRYALNQRQWSLLLDRDHRFRLYVYQNGWKTVGCRDAPVLGSWHQVGCVIGKGEAALWVNGELVGEIQLDQKIIATTAPVTFGGVDDNGRVWQNFTGALDEIRIFESPLDHQSMVEGFRHVDAKHELPVNPEPVALWSGKQVPNSGEIERLKNVDFHVIKRYEPDVDGYGFLHGVAVAWHRGKLYASFGHNKGSENTLTEEGRYCVSEDGGESWSAVRTIDVGLESEDLAVSHGVFLSFRGSLWAFLGSFYGTRQNVHTRAYVLDEESGQWRAKGSVIEEGFWPMTEPVKMNDGNWVMPGFIVAGRNPPAVAISNGDDLNRWQVRVIRPGRQVGNLWGESSVVVNGSQLINIARYGAKPLSLVAHSQDYGTTWTASLESNLPMATSKPCSGTLSTGQNYLIASMSANGGGRRSPLTIALSRPGEVRFSELFTIRDAVFPDGPGESDPKAALSYPYATEYQGKLYVGYSNNGSRRANNNSAELAVIPLESLQLD